MSARQLADEELAERDYWFIEHFGEQLEMTNKLLMGEGHRPDFDPDMFRATIIADVHTDGNTEQVLQAGVGWIRTLVAVYLVSDGRLLVGAGPVFSYYEFKQPMDQRLTNEAWRRMLREAPPPEPEWTAGFYAGEPGGR